MQLGQLALLLPELLELEARPACGVCDVTQIVDGLEPPAKWPPVASAVTVGAGLDGLTFWAGKWARIWSHFFSVPHMPLGLYLVLDTQRSVPISATSGIAAVPLLTFLRLYGPPHEIVASRLTLFGRKSDWT